MKISLVLEKVRSAYNVGSIFRSADSAGFDHVYLIAYTITPPAHKLQKTALGAEEHVAWSHFDTTQEAITEIRKQQHSHIVGLEITDTSQDLFTWNPPEQLIKEEMSELCLVVGNEVDGLHADTLALVDEVVHIPQRGHKSSLNVASAAAIAAYEITRKLKYDNI